MRLFLIAILLLCAVGCSEQVAPEPVPEDSADIIFESEVHSPDEFPIEKRIEIQQKGGIR